MDPVEAITTIAAAVIGAVAALGGAAWTFRHAAEESRRERLSSEMMSMRALRMEINVAAEIAEEMSPSRLPTQMLQAAMAGIHHMENAQQESIIRYSQSALRYNGRVERIIAYGSGKRAFGKSPGSEKPENQAGRVLESIPPALQAIDSHLRSNRFKPNKRGRRA
jgi:hypothetical protein